MNSLYFYLSKSIITSPSPLKTILDILNSRWTVILFLHFRIFYCSLDSFTFHKHPAVDLTMAYSEVICRFSIFEIFIFSLCSSAVLLWCVYDFLCVSIAQEFLSFSNLGILFGEILNHDHFENFFGPTTLNKNLRNPCPRNKGKSRSVLSLTRTKT